MTILYPLLARCRRREAVEAVGTVGVVDDQAGAWGCGSVGVTYAASGMMPWA
jgi:hypothetical protein